MQFESLGDGINNQLIAKFILVPGAFDRDFTQQNDCYSKLLCIIMSHELMNRMQQSSSSKAFWFLLHLCDPTSIIMDKCRTAQQRVNWQLFKFGSRHEQGDPSLTLYTMEYNCKQHCQQQITLSAMYNWILWASGHADFQTQTFKVLLVVTVIGI